MTQSWVLQFFSGYFLNLFYIYFSRFYVYIHYKYNFRSIWQVQWPCTGKHSDLSHAKTCDAESLKTRTCMLFIFKIFHIFLFEAQTNQQLFLVTRPTIFFSADPRLFLIIALLSHVPGAHNAIWNVTQNTHRGNSKALWKFVSVLINHNLYFLIPHVSLGWGKENKTEKIIAQ